MKQTLMPSTLKSGMLETRQNVLLTPGNQDTTNNIKTQ